MSRQLNYIVSAFLLLAIAVAGYSFFKKIPTVVFFSDRNNDWCGTDTDIPVLYLSETAQKGKAIFNSRCASCHILFKEATGPDLVAVMSGEQWADKNKLYAWIKNPAAYMQNDPYTSALQKKYGSMMTAFDGVITNEEIDAIVEYIKAAGNQKVVPIQ